IHVSETRRTRGGASTDSGELGTAHRSAPGAAEGALTHSPLRYTRATLALAHKHPSATRHRPPGSTAKRSVAISGQRHAALQRQRVRLSKDRVLRPPPDDGRRRDAIRSVLRGYPRSRPVVGLPLSRVGATQTHTGDFARRRT